MNEFYWPKTIEDGTKEKKAGDSLFQFTTAKKYRFIYIVVWRVLQLTATAVENEVPGVGANPDIRH